MIEDCLRANSWALRWAAYGSEDTIEKQEEFWKNLLRTNTFGSSFGDMHTFQKVYTAAQWRIAYAMKAGKTFDTTVDELVDDERWIERQIKQAEFAGNTKGGKLAESKGGGRDKRRSRSRSRRDGGKGGGRDRDRRRSRSRSRRDGGKAGSSQRRTDQDKAFKERGRHERSVSRNGTPICRNFNCGICKKPAKDGPNPDGKATCRFSHTCWNCRRPKCKGAFQCSNNPGGQSGAGR